MTFDYGSAMPANRRREWSPPMYVDQRVSVSGLVTAASPGGTLAGYWSCCDVWLTAPLAWWGNSPGSPFKLYAVNGASRTLLVDAILGRFAYVSDGTTATALVGSVRGFPCERFDAFFAASDGSALADGQVRMECWGCEADLQVSSDGLDNPAAGNAIKYPKTPPSAHISLLYARAGVQATDFRPLRVNSSNELLVAAAVTPVAATAYDSTTWVDSGVIKASAGSLSGIHVVSKSAANIYLHLFNLAAVPANGTAPNFPPIPIALTAGLEQVVDLTFGEERPFSTGMSYAASTTRDTLTVTATAPIWLAGEYR